MPLQGRVRDSWCFVVSSATCYRVAERNRNLDPAAVLRPCWPDLGWHSRTGQALLSLINRPLYIFSTLDTFKRGTVLSGFQSLDSASSQTYSENNFLKKFPTEHVLGFFISSLTQHAIRSDEEYLVIARWHTM